jgi:hypothetical protein
MVIKTERKEKPIKSNRTVKASMSIKKTTARQRGVNPIVTLNMAERKIMVSREKIKEFVNTLPQGTPLIINIPMPEEKNDIAEYHAILVYIRDHDVLVSDWGGDRRTESHKQYFDSKKWRNYKVLLEVIESELEKHVKFVEIDEDLEKEAMDVHTSRKRACAPGGEGGCSYYIFKWTEKHLPDLLSETKPPNKSPKKTPSKKMKARFPEEPSPRSADSRSRMSYSSSRISDSSKSPDSSSRMSDSSKSPESTSRMSDSSKSPDSSSRMSDSSKIPEPTLLQKIWRQFFSGK